MDRRLLTPKEAAEELGRSDAFVRGLIARRRLVSLRINGRYYIPGWSLDELVRPDTATKRHFAMEIKPKRGATPKR
jgi:excisionase family DNA binding protein